MSNESLKSKSKIWKSLLVIFKNDILVSSRSRNEVMMLLRRNPNVDLSVLRQKYPDVDIEKLIRTDKIRGHFVPKVEG